MSGAFLLSGKSISNRGSSSGLILSRQCSPLSLVESFRVLKYFLGVAIYAIKNQLRPPKTPTRSWRLQHLNLGPRMNQSSNWGSPPHILWFRTQFYDNFCWKIFSISTCWKNESFWQPERLIIFSIKWSAKQGQGNEKFEKSYFFFKIQFSS